MINKGGRPKTYSDNDLIKILEEYVDSHKDEKIILSKLSKDTGVARHIWDYSLKVKELIQKLNNPVILSDKISSDLEVLPSVESLLEQNSSNPSKLRLAIETCLNVINSLKGKINECYQLEKDKMVLEKQLLELKDETRLLKEQLKKQETAMLEMCIDSESHKKRKDKGLNDNIIKIEVRENINQTIALNEEDILKEFPWLAD